jgi:hypothetical protein
MKAIRLTSALLTATALFAVAGCAILPFKKQVPAQKVRVERLTVTGRYAPRSDRFEVWVMISGYRSANEAKWLPPRQWLDGYRVHLEQLEQPLSANAGLEQRTPFSRSLPIDTSDLPPGFYIVNVNGAEKRLEIPEPPVEEDPTAERAPAGTADRLEP